MSTILTVLLAALSWVLVSTRPAPANARTCTEMRADIRSAGWARVAARTLQIAVAVALLSLACGIWTGLRVGYWIGTVIAVIGMGVADLGGGPELIGGAA